jgi:hypothetical protein
MTIPEMTIIVLVPDSCDAIREGIRSLQHQTVRHSLEIILVGGSRASMGVDEKELSVFHGFQVIELGTPFTNTRARAAGVRSASAPVVYFLEDHVFPFRDWAEHLIAAHRAGWAGVGSEIVNANPASFTGWANLVMAFGCWMERQTEGVRDRIPSHNSAYKKDVLLGYGDDLENQLASENLMQDDLRAHGHSFYLQPKARIAHLNISRFQSFFLEQYSGGRLFGASRCKAWSFPKRAAYGVAFPLVPLKRLIESLEMMRRAGTGKRLITGILPPLAFGLFVHSFGEAMGYVFGPGNAEEISMRLEFSHDRHLCSCDRNWRESLEAVSPAAGSPVKRRKGFTGAT